MFLVGSSKWTNDLGRVKMDTLGQLLGDSNVVFNLLVWLLIIAVVVMLVWRPFARLFRKTPNPPQNLEFGDRYD